MGQDSERQKAAAVRLRIEEEWPVSRCWGKEKLAFKTNQGGGDLENTAEFQLQALKYYFQNEG